MLMCQTVPVCMGVVNVGVCGCDECGCVWVWCGQQSELPDLSFQNFMLNCRDALRMYRLYQQWSEQVSLVPIQ